MQKVFVFVIDEEVCYTSVGIQNVNEWQAIKVLQTPMKMDEVQFTVLSLSGLVTPHR